MKTVWKSFLREPCRVREITEEERTALSHYHPLQRHFPAMEAFRAPEEEEGKHSLELPSHYYINHLTPSDPSGPCTSTTREWTALRQDTTGKEQEVACRVFSKVVHLLHPVDYLRRPCSAPAHPLLPSTHTSAWNKTITKLQHRNNQAYVDAVANFVLSRYRERGFLPHLVLYYGSYTGLSQSYRYNLTEEYESYRHHRWFWDGLKEHQSLLTLAHPSGEEPPTEDAYLTWRREIMERPSDLRSSSSRSSSSFSSYSSEIDAEEVEVVAGTEPLPELDPLEEIQWIQGAEEKEEDEDEEEEEEEDKEEEEEDEEEPTWQDDTEIFLEIPNLPVQLILLEAQDGSMDQLLDEEEMDGHAHGSVEWEKRWIAWLFQVVATLTFLQEAISFTHNDLHTNNILWRSTDKPYLYYRLKGKKGVWRVPTYGKIFSLIDFGRSIFRIGKHQWISDDFWPNEDAAGQYNFGPFYDKKEPKQEPNPSFDLCRLSVSLLSGLFPDPPPKKKGKHVGMLSEEGSWKVYETRSPLYNLLWRWTLDDAGRTVYENRHGEERYEGFDLYVQIAHHVHGAVPKEQLHQGVFQGFLWKQPVPAGEPVYGLDA